MEPHPLGTSRGDGRNPRHSSRQGDAGQKRSAMSDDAPKAWPSPADRTRAGMQAADDREDAAADRDDAAAGRPIELDAIGGAVVRLATRHGIAVPVTARYVDDLRDRYPTA